jgi:hypothetical protein
MIYEENMAVYQKLCSVSLNIEKAHQRKENIEEIIIEINSKMA